MSEGGKKRWALVTGASAGIGFAFADVLAQADFNIVLMARREGHLQKHANWLEDKYHVKTLVIVDDLEDAGAPVRILQRRNKQASQSIF